MQLDAVFEIYYTAVMKNINTPQHVLVYKYFLKSEFTDDLPLLFICSCLEQKFK